jgi:phosphoribosyl-AMP cyclohydrolase
MTTSGTTPARPWTPRSDLAGDKAAIEAGRNFSPLFDRDGLIPVIVTDHATREILMFAWMNDEALQRTIDTGFAHFWTRSRQRLWMKGEESGNRLAVRSMLTDCDQDVLLLRVEIEGLAVACHTGARSCFYREVDLSPGGPRPLSLVPDRPKR